MSAQCISEPEPVTSRLVFPRVGGAIAWAGRRIAHLLGALELALQVRRERRMLMGMDQGMLKDLGLNGTAYREASRPFWDVPRERLPR